MKIQNLRREKHGNRERILADITWEESERAGSSVFFETDQQFAAALACNPHPFLVGCLLPAMHHKERRIHLEGEICPELRRNLHVAMSWIRHWYYEPDFPLVTIEAPIRSSPTTPPIPERTGCFLSGGVDGFATLHANHLSYPKSHPEAIRDGLLIHGQNIESDTSPQTFQDACLTLADVVRELNVTLRPVYTNIRLVDDDRFMFSINHGAILGAVAHAFANRLTTMYISGSDSITTLSLVGRDICKPHGSHPLLDPLYSSHDLDIKHDGITTSRLDKVRQISEWDAALQNIKVCGPNWPGENCCRCEKCVRTMLELLAVGALHKTRAFSRNDVTAEAIARLRIKKPAFGYTVDDDYLELIEPLQRIGREDLGRAIKSMIHQSRSSATSLGQTLRMLKSLWVNGKIEGPRGRSVKQMS